jgi:Flp pilus assembly protein TadD
LTTQAASILRRLGERDLAWDYVTTPAGLKPSEAEPWQTMAASLSQSGELDLADRAYGSLH